MKNQTTNFLLKAGILLAPLIILLVIYFCLDPFKVLRKYESYMESAEGQVALNAGYVSVETFLHNYPKYKYDSIIFGNSRSRFYPVAEWRKHIDTLTECFHFDASDESLYGLYKKFEFLEKNDIKLKNVLIVLDWYLLRQAVDNDRFLNKQHPLLTLESPYAFQLRSLKAFFNAKFIISYLDFKIRGKIRPYMEDTLRSTPISYNVVTNEATFDVYESLIEKNRDSFYLPRKEKFPVQGVKEKIANPAIRDKQKEQLTYIKNQLDKNNTSYRIVVSPLYFQEKLNIKDIRVLNEIFGKEYVFDFSGKNAITSNMYNYYEKSHYRPHVCKLIMDIIYKEK